MPAEAALKPSALRGFSRVFTQRAGLLREAPYDPSLNLLESRIVFELAREKTLRAKDLAERLAIDKGHLSRVLASLRRRGVLTALPSTADGRERLLALASHGRKLFEKIDAVSEQRAQTILDALGETKAQDLLRHLRAAELLLEPKTLRLDQIKLRGLEPGDLGWVISRHGELYGQEYGWNAEFELLVAEIATAFAKKHDSAKERAWIAHAGGLRLGCVFLVRDSDVTAKLRILLVDPAARGLGLGALLVGECLRYAKTRGYKKITLWTNDVLASARKIYEASGFVLDREQKHDSFGKRLTGQYWTKKL